MAVRLGKQLATGIVRGKESNWGLIYRSGRGWRVEYDVVIDFVGVNRGGEGWVGFYS